MFITMSNLVGLGLIAVGTCVYQILKGDSEPDFFVGNSGSNSDRPTRKFDDSVDHFKKTMDYCYNLSEQELRDYMKNNYDLRKYGSNIDLDRDKYHVCQDIADLGRRLGRSFDDRYDRY